MSTGPLDVLQLFSDPWEGEAVVARPWWLCWMPIPSKFRFRSEIRDVRGDTWTVHDTISFPKGRQQHRTMRAHRLADGQIRIAAEDMPGGATLTPNPSGFAFTPYVIKTPVLGPLRLPLRHHDTIVLTDPNTMLDTIHIRLAGITLAKVTIRLRRAITRASVAEPPSATPQ